MNEDQGQAILDLSTKKISEKKFYKRYGVVKNDILGEVDSQLKQALAEKNSSNVELSLLLGFSFGFPEGIVDTLHELVVSDWHHQHEDIIRLLQKYALTESIDFVSKAVHLKPRLEYLNYDDYGAYYKKCLWVLQAIGTSKAIEAIEILTKSEDAILREQAEYRLSKITGIS